MNTQHLGKQLPFQGRIMEGSHGGVAVETQECSDVGTGILKQGGTAVDAAIASALCIGVMHVLESLITFISICSGGFMLIRSPNGTYEFIDFRDKAPQATYQNMFVKNPSLTKFGGLSIGIPGDLRGFELAHKRHGALPWSQLFPPAIKLARDGFRATPYFWILEDPEYSKIYAPSGTLAQPGDILKRPALAKTLETIAKEGADAFYTGPIAESTVKTIQNAGGIITLKDLQDYRPKIRPTIHTYYHGKKVTTASAPTSGPILISMLNILERYNLGSLGRIGLNLHRLVEAMKFGNAFRTELGDPDFNSHSQDRYQEIISKEWASQVRVKISDNTTHPSEYYQPKYDTNENHGTMHMSIVDQHDGVVSMTTTLNHHFGSRVMDPVTGIVFNNGLDDFSIPGVPNFFGYTPSVSNYLAPGKRAQSSITPVIVESDGRFFMALGGSGGSQIPTSVVSVLTNVLDYNMDLYEAVATPRLHHQLMPNALGIEKSFDANLTRLLKSRHHEVKTNVIF
ncbi:gamma-glutamyltransferase [Chlamydoabsidia padenii]|nr:gamma-glutamyltransferase [Chlamydoabsidia padenii]